MLDGDRWRRLIDRGFWAEDRVLQRRRFPIGPRNTVSNVAYLIAAAGLFYWRPAGAASVVLGLALVLLGIGSALYHGLKRHWANSLDWSGMFAALGSSAAFGVVPESRAAPAVMAIFSAVLVGVFVYKLRLKVDALMGVFLVFAVLRPLALGPGRWWAIAALAIFVLSYVAWWLDHRAGEQGRPAPIVRLWGHGVWHVGTAAALVLLHLGHVAAAALSSR